jgi:hypothetical protein
MKLLSNVLGDARSNEHSILQGRKISAEDLVHLEGRVVTTNDLEALVTAFLKKSPRNLRLYLLTVCISHLLWFFARGTNNAIVKVGNTSGLILRVDCAPLEAFDSAGSGVGGLRRLFEMATCLARTFSRIEVHIFRGGRGAL